MLEEDRPLSGAEQAVARSALDSLPAALRASAFAGAGEELAECVARCVRGEGSARAAACLRATLQWRAAVGADTVRRLWVKAWARSLPLA
jgi:hypothetical protein